MCNRGDYQSDESDIDRSFPPRLPDGRPLLSRIEPKFVECGNCIFWKRLPKDDSPRCRKNAPKPVINSSFMDTRQITVWPVTALTDGYFEGDEKDAVEEYSLIQNGKEVLRIPVHKKITKSLKM